MALIFVVTCIGSNEGNWNFEVDELSEVSIILSQISSTK